MFVTEMRRLNAVSHRECASPQTVGTIMITMKRSDEKERSIERSIKEKAARVTRSAKQIGGRSQGALVSSLYFCTTLVPYLSPPPSPISPLSSFASLITHSILTTSGVVWTGTSSGGPFVKVSSKSYSYRMLKIQSSRTREGREHPRRPLTTR